MSGGRHGSANRRSGRRHGVLIRLAWPDI